MRKIIIGVVGPGKEAKADSIQNAVQLGVLIANEGWVILSGGRNCGVMDAVHKGAKQAHGLTLGILPNDDYSGMSSSVDIPIVTGMGQARNNVNVLSSDLLIACGMGAGTASEIALAIKANKKVILLGCDDEATAFFRKIGESAIRLAETPEAAIHMARKLLLQDISGTNKLERSEPS